MEYEHITYQNIFQWLLWYRTVLQIFVMFLCTSQFRFVLLHISVWCPTAVVQLTLNIFKCSNWSCLVNAEVRRAAKYQVVKKEPRSGELGLTSRGLEHFRSQMCLFSRYVAGQRNTSVSTQNWEAEVTPYIWGVALLWIVSPSISAKCPAPI